MSDDDFDRVVERLGSRLHYLELHAPKNSYLRLAGHVEWVKELYESVAPERRSEIYRRMRGRADQTCDLCLKERMMNGPVGRFHEIARTVAWASNDQCDRKAYLLSMLCELAYLKVSRFDVDGSDRYDFIGSQALDLLLASRERFQVERVFADVDLPFEVLEREFFTYVVTRVGEFAIVAVRGTAKAGDWLINLHAQALLGTEADYHPGFWQEAGIGLRELRSKLHTPLEQIYFTGHSLGGAIAALLAQSVSDFKPYVFGSPRFGNRAAVRYGAPWAYVRSADLVPHLPPKSLGYADAADQLRVVGAEERLTGLQTLKEWLPSGKRFAVQHSIEGYRRLLGFELGEDFPDGAYLEMRGFATRRA